MPKEPVTFVVFAGDLVTFALKKLLNVDYRFPHQTASHRKTFHAAVGEAALVFRERHSDEFAEMIGAFPTFVAEDAESAVDYLEKFVGEHFKGRVPLMELLVYCAFLVDLCVCCVENGRTDLIDDIVSETYDVYDDHVRPYFAIVGGWLALLQIARDYLRFVESMRAYSVLVATGSEKGDRIPSTHDSTDAISTQSNHSKLRLEVAVDTVAHAAKDIKSIGYAVCRDNTISGLEIKTSQSIISASASSLDIEYIQALAIEISCVDSDDLMSVSSADTEENVRISSAATDVIASTNTADTCVIRSETDISSPFTEYRQATASETASAYSEDLISIASSYSEESNDIGDLECQNGFLQHAGPRVS